MATQILMLGPEDVLQPTDWVRPLVETPGEFQSSPSSINSFSTFGGTPLNHFKWVPARDVMGELWFGQSLAEIHRRWAHLGGFNYEVVRGEVPMAHVWDWRKEKPE